MFNFDNITNENNAEKNLQWPFIPDDSYRILIIGDSASVKTNTLFNLKKEQDGKFFYYYKRFIYTLKT